LFNSANFLFADPASPVAAVNCVLSVSKLTAEAVAAVPSATIGAVTVAVIVAPMLASPSPMLRRRAANADERDSVSSSVEAKDFNAASLAFSPERKPESSSFSSPNNENALVAISCYIAAAMKTFPLIVLFLAVLACNMQPKPAASSSPAKTPTPSTPIPATPTPEGTIISTVEDYTAEFSANEVAAAKKYEGKAVQLSGVVSDITSSTITFEGSGSILVVCRHSDEKAATLRKGQRASFKGRSGGLSLGVYANVNDCRLI
jgi:hypothetical protein